MNFSRSGWFQRYIAFRTAQPLPHALPSHGVRVLEQGLHHEVDQAVYYFLQPTGLLYGFPVAPPFRDQAYPGEAYLDAGSRALLYFLESLFACLVADRHYLLSDLADEPDHLPPAVALTTEYFLSGPAATRRAGGFRLPRLPALGRRTPYAALERALRRRVLRRTEFLPLPGTFYNSFLFLDLYGCLQWQRRMLVEPEEPQRHLAELDEQQQALQALILRLMMAAALADGAVQSRERRVLDWFLRASDLPRGSVRTLRRSRKHGLLEEDTTLPPLPWLLRRFVLELMLMVQLVERSLDAQATAFMQQAVEQLDLWQEELQQSITALEVFILQQGERLPVLSQRSALLNVGDALAEQATIAVRKNMARIMTEIRETQELYNLLLKATTTPLSPEERTKVRAQLMDIIKTIPALAIFALPGGGFILPLVLRLLPFNLLPSSFEE